MVVLAYRGKGKGEIRAYCDFDSRLDVCHSSLVVWTGLASKNRKM